MKTYSFDKLPDANGPKVDEYITSDYPSTLSKFLKDAFWDNLFVFRSANIFYVILLCAGIFLAIFAADYQRLCLAILVVAFVKIYFVVQCIKLYKSFKKRQIFALINSRGISHMVLVPDTGRSFRITTMKWQDLKTLRVYKDFVTFEIKNSTSVKDDIALAYFWSNDVEKLTEQILALWKQALSEREPSKPMQYRYTYEENEEIREFIASVFGCFEYEFYRKERDKAIPFSIAIIPPSPERDCYTLCTIGAGAYQMEVDKEARLSGPLSEYAEYVMCLPSDWKFDEESLDDNKYSWPLYLLTDVVDWPYEANTWQAPGQMFKIDMSDYYEELSCNHILLTSPAPDVLENLYCNMSTRRSVVFNQLVPLNPTEVAYYSGHSYCELMEMICPEDADVLKALVANR